MKKFIFNIVNSKLVKIGFFNSTSIVVKIIASLISSKALAYFIGPSGLGFFGVFKEFFNMSSNVASLGFVRGIIKYTSENRDTKSELNSFINTVSLLGFFFSILFGVGLFIFSNYLSIYLFNDYGFILVFRILAFIIPVSTLSIFSLAILNGLGYENQIIRINILLYILNMILIVLLSYFFGTKGALVGMSLIYCLQFISIIFFKPKGFSLRLIGYLKISKEYSKKILGYTLMTITSLLLFPLISILIRGEIINSLGQDFAGYWEGMKRISENYILFATSLVTLSVLPRLSQTNSNFRKIVFDYYKKILPLFIILLVLIFLSKKLIILVFYTPDFLPMQPLFKWYVLGDLFRIMGVVIAANFFAKRQIISYILSDLFLAAIMYYSSIYLLGVYNLEGGGIAYLISYVFYFLLLLVIYYKPLFLKMEKVEND